jgi:hypothetical protein
MSQTQVSFKHLQQIATAYFALAVAADVSSDDPLQRSDDVLQVTRHSLTQQ